MLWGTIQLHICLKHWRPQTHPSSAIPWAKWLPLPHSTAGWDRGAKSCPLVSTGQLGKVISTPEFPGGSSWYWLLLKLHLLPSFISQLVLLSFTIDFLWDYLEYYITLYSLAHESNFWKYLKKERKSMKTQVIFWWKHELKVWWRLKLVCRVLAFLRLMLFLLLLLSV